jgi:hypothetical protein
MLFTGTRSHETSVYKRERKQTQGPTKCAGSRSIVMVLKEPRAETLKTMPLVSNNKLEAREGIRESENFHHREGGGGVHGNDKEQNKKVANKKNVLKRCILTTRVDVPNETKKTC